MSQSPRWGLGGEGDARVCLVNCLCPGCLQETVLLVPLVWKGVRRAEKGLEPGQRTVSAAPQKSESYSSREPCLPRTHSIL